MQVALAAVAPNREVPTGNASGLAIQMPGPGQWQRKFRSPEFPISRTFSGSFSAVQVPARVPKRAPLVELVLTMISMRRERKDRIRGIGTDRRDRRDRRDRKGSEGSPPIVRDRKRSELSEKLKDGRDLQLEIGKLGNWEIGKLGI